MKTTKFIIIFFFALLYFLNPFIPFSDLDNLDASANGVTYRPAIGGIQINLNESEHFGYGTIGFAAIDDQGNTGYVTAAHVVQNMSYQIWQSYDFGGDEYYKLGKATKFSSLENSDSAWIPCDTTFTVLPEVYNPTIGLPDFKVESYANATEGDHVFFLGNTNGLQNGTVINDDAWLYDDGFCGFLYNQSIIDKSDATASGGDSGAPVFKISGYNSIEIV